MKFNKILLPTTLVTFTTAQSLNEQQETTDEQNQVDASQVLVSSTALSDGLGGSSIPTDSASVGDSGSDPSGGTGGDSDSSGGTGGDSDSSGGTGGESDPSGGTGGGPNPEDKDKDEPDTGDKDKDEPEPEDKDKDGPKPEDKDKDESKPKDTVGTTPTDEDGTTSSEPEPTSTPLVTDTETTPGILPIIYPSNNETLTKFTTKTEIVTAFTTYCPEPTTIITNEKTIIVSEPTTLTITDCPCTITKTIPIHTLPAVVTSSKGASATSSVAKPTAEVISNGAIDVAPSVMGIVAAALMLL